MAGNYPDVPGNRIPYDLNGTIALHWDFNNVVTQMATGVMQMTNNETTDNASTAYFPTYFNDWNYCLLFPEAYNLVGMYVQVLSGNNHTPVVYYSTNTTNGIDGTWTSLPSVTYTSDAASPGYRTQIDSAIASNVKAVKVYCPDGPGSTYLSSVHIYGTPVAASNRLNIWHPTDDAAISGAYFDWGDVPRGYTFTRQFRVKNVGSLTANTVTLSLDALTSPTPSVVTQHSLSSDGTNFSSSLSLGNLSPGQISGVLTLKYVVSGSAALSLHAIRMVSSAASWS